MRSKQFASNSFYFKLQSIAGHVQAYKFRFSLLETCDKPSRQGDQSLKPFDCSGRPQAESQVWAVEQPIACCRLAGPIRLMQHIL